MNRNRNQMNPGFIGTEERDIAELKGRLWRRRLRRNIMWNPRMRRGKLSLFPIMCFTNHSLYTSFIFSIKLNSLVKSNLLISVLIFWLHYFYIHKFLFNNFFLFCYELIREKSFDCIYFYKTLIVFGRRNVKGFKNLF